MKMFARKTTQELDNILFTVTIPHLRAQWNNPEAGIVAATLVDGDEMSTATSSQCSDSADIYRHAERNAYSKFVKEHKKEPSKNAAFVITLSPCLRHMPERDGASCTHLALEKGIKRVHFAVLDNVHAGSFAYYQKMSGLDITLTRNQQCKTTCENLMKLFSLKNKSNEWPRIKQNIPDIFAPMDKKPIVEKAPCRIFRRFPKLGQATSSLIPSAPSRFTRSRL